MSTSDVIRQYDKGGMYRPFIEQYYDRSGFFNYGYWRDGARNQREACERLVEKLLEFLPARQGTILDVACGMGATSRYLLKYYDASNVVGINISEKQLESSRANAPGCTFLQMDAAQLTFEDGVFDTVICVESAFHFKTREKFLHEAWRVLKPGGYVLLSDIIFITLPNSANSSVPVENRVKDLEEYRALYQRAGFQEVDVVDATQECARGFFQHIVRWAGQKLLAREMSLRNFAEVVLWPLVGRLIIKQYLLVAARKV